MKIILLILVGLLSFSSSTLSMHTDKEEGKKELSFVVPARPQQAPLAAGEGERPEGLGLSPAGKNSKKDPLERSLTPRKGAWGATEREIEEAFKHSKNLICIVEFGGHFKRLNPKWTEVLGWSVEELLSKPYYEFIHPEDMQMTREYESHFIPAGFVSRYRHKDGTYRSLNWIGLARSGGSKQSIVIFISF